MANINSTDIDTPELDTFPKILSRNSMIFRNHPAMREKKHGIWETISWNQQFSNVKKIAIGLHKIGIRKNDKVAIIGDNRPRLYQSICSIQSIGAIPVPCYQDSVAEEMSYILNHAEVKIAIVEDQEQVDKLLEIKEKTPELKSIIYDDSRGMTDYKQEFIYNLDSLSKIQLKQNDKEFNFERSIKEGKSNDTAIILYTSGTTGKPKGVLLSYKNIISVAKKASEIEHLTLKDNVLAYLPMAWIGDNVFSYAQSYITGFCVNCPESTDTVMNDMREIGPTYYFGPPRIFENMLTTVNIRMADANALKRSIFLYYMKVAYKVGNKIIDRKSVSIIDKINYMIGELLIYAPLKNILGLTRVRKAYTAGEAISPDIFKFFRSLGINLKQLYGSTEGSVYVTLQRDGEIEPDTVGTPFPGVDIKIDNGELLFKSSGVFIEYYKNEIATAETKTSDGYVRTGDAGFFNKNGHIKIIDRAKDVGKLSSGQLFAPKYIENKLKFHSEIKEAVAFGNEKEYCCCFINIDLDAVGSLAERNNIAYSGYTDLAANKMVYNLINQAIVKVNNDLSKDEELKDSIIKRFLILHKELDADDGELTRTRKLRRRTINERYNGLIEAMYSNKDNFHVVTEVTFEDGRKDKIEATIAIQDVGSIPSNEKNNDNK